MRILRRTTLEYPPHSGEVLPVDQKHLPESKPLDSGFSTRASGGTFFRIQAGSPWAGPPVHARPAPPPATARALKRKIGTSRSPPPVPDRGTGTG